MAVIIRPGRADDLEAIREFTTATFEWGDYVPDRYLDWLNEPQTLVLIAADTGDAPIAVGRVALLSHREAWFSAARVRPTSTTNGS